MNSLVVFRAGLLLSVCVAGSPALIGCRPAVNLTVGGNQGRLLPAGYANVSAKTKTQAAADGARQLTVFTKFGAIDVDAAADGNVTVNAELTASGPYSQAQLQGWVNAMRVKLDRSEDGLEVQLWRPGNLPRSVSISASYHIRAPKQLALKLESSNGEVTSRNVGGSVHAESTFGAVTVTDVRGPVFAHSSNGAVTVERVAGDVEAASTFGAVELKAIRGEIRGRSNNGAVSARDTRADRKSVDLKSSFGEVQFAGAAGMLSATSNNGAVKLELDNTPRDTHASSSFGAVEATLPAGADAEVDADTSFGRVTMKNMGVAEEENSGSTGQSRSVRLGKGGNPVKLHSANGGVTVRRR